MKDILFFEIIHFFLGLFMLKLIRLKTKVLWKAVSGNLVLFQFRDQRAAVHIQHFGGLDLIEFILFERF